MGDIQLQSRGGTTARIAPDAGFCCLSWCVEEKEYLHLPVPEDEFRVKPKTGGVPLLYPYANRLREDPWPEHPEVKRDDNGLPIHGFLLRFAAWDDVASTSDTATATLEWANHAELMALFPHPHRLEVTFKVDDRSLRATTRVTANGGSDVPISFGWHPYLTLPGVGREGLALEVPPLCHVALDAQGIPVRSETGRLNEDAAASPSGPLAGRELDDLYQRDDDADLYALRGGGHCLQISMDQSWSFVQLYSPHGADFACIEPMTAPVAALSDDRDHPVAASGTTFEASFQASVS
jgi:galactose mutarotase-like enzyme